MKRDDQDDIEERSLTFFCNVIAFVETVPLSARTSRIIEQLVDAAGSISTNRDEAIGGASRGEFLRFTENSLRGANNSIQWLQVCADRKIGSQEKCVSVLSDGRQLARMLSRIVIAAKRRGEDPRPGRRTFRSA
jgi:four helix bundle protein